MRKTLLAALVIALVLAACSAPVQVYEDDGCTTDYTVMQTTEETAAEELITMQQLPQMHPPELGRVITLSNTQTLFEIDNAGQNSHGQWEFSREIWLRNETTGNETQLLGSQDDYSPTLHFAVNDRFFAYSRFIPETCARTNIRFFDTQLRRSIALNTTDTYYFWDVKEITSERVYLVGGMEPGHWPDTLSVAYFPLVALEQGVPVTLHPAGTISLDNWETLESPYRTY
jgi:hypothetical protein